ncbi:hypothetical protein HYC85_022719 [Camellia sinensis]|uniref:Uncharacterized protein n=1 Tax=Camellia sinensis TaxID=4442 RepID=A0A7J7GCL4_CAMSI|nr:hypothetical protein HYC85_022719 [Camellia sinensis]
MQKYIHPVSIRYGYGIFYSTTHRRMTLRMLNSPLHYALELEHVLTEMSPRQYRGIFHALSTVFREEGPRALYRGWLPSVIGVVSYPVLIPYVGLNFAVYESLKDWLIKSRPFGLVENTELSVTTKLACGAAAGTVGQTVAYPLDVIRRRMQMVGWKDAASVVTGDGKSKAPLEYSGMVDAFRKTVRHEGFGALYKGLVPNSVKRVHSPIHKFDFAASPFLLASDQSLGFYFLAALPNHYSGSVESPAPVQDLLNFVLHLCNEQEISIEDFSFLLFEYPRNNSE